MNLRRFSPYELLLWTFLIAIHLLNLSLHSVGELRPEASVSAKPMHLLALFFSLFLIGHLRFVYADVGRNLAIVGFFANGLVVSLVHPYIDSLSPMVVKLAFGFYCFLIGLDICNRISKEQFLRMLRIVSWVTLLAILVKGAWYFPELRAASHA